MAYRKIAVVLGNCLFPDHGALDPDSHTVFFMAEDVGLCTHFKYHKHKLVLFLSAMRSHRDALADNHPVRYWELTAENQHLSYEEKLARTLDEYARLEEVVMYDIEDKFMARRMETFCRARGLKLTIVDSPGFFTTQRQFADFLEGSRPAMHRFYQWQRRRLGVLLDEAGKPVGGKWSYDPENRKKLPQGIVVPEVPASGLNDHDRAVIGLVDELFPDHPGSTDTFGWATTRRAALYQLRNFIEERFAHFGPYEDAISREHAHVFHSVLSPYINLGLITAPEVLEAALEHAAAHDTHLPSVEGFTRQLIGWREFMRGMYHTHNLTGNHFGHTRQMRDCWYEGTTGVPVLDTAIRRVIRHGWAHHIERLMVLGNLMLLCELHPDAVYRWFMELFVDSSDWVMVPNVYGMSQFADGGTFATKPYLSGSNYLLKMSDFPRGDWTLTVDGLYWRFVDRHRDLFRSNPRLSMMVRMYEKKTADQKATLQAAAEAFIGRVTEG